jgi:hypothetical protein
MNATLKFNKYCVKCGIFSLCKFLKFLYKSYSHNINMNTQNKNEIINYSLVDYMYDSILYFNTQFFNFKTKINTVKYKHSKEIIKNKQNIIYNNKKPNLRIKIPNLDYIKKQNKWPHRIMKDPTLLYYGDKNKCLEDAKIIINKILHDYIFKRNYNLRYSKKYFYFTYFNVPYDIYGDYRFPKPPPTKEEFRYHVDIFILAIIEDYFHDMSIRANNAYQYKTQYQIINPKNPDVLLNMSWYNPKRGSEIAYYVLDMIKSSENELN